MRNFTFLTRVLPQIIITASLIVALVPPIPAQAADMAIQDTVMQKIIEYCGDRPEWASCPEEHWGGPTNQNMIFQKCPIDHKEQNRCMHEELIGLEINKKFRSNSGNSGNNDKCDVAVPLRLPPECIGNVPGSYPNTKCFTGNGGVMQEKLCPRNAVYPNGDPPSPDKCYASTTTESTGGRDVYEESSCDKSTFTIAPPGEEVPKPEEELNTSCTERMKLSAGWIVCSVLELVSDGISSLFDIADSMLNVDGQNLYDSEELRAIWSYFRVVATFALVIIGLVMVISQAIGGGL